MLVWKAISSMVLMMLAMLSEEDLMAFMASIISFMPRAPVSAASRVSLAMLRALTAFSLLRAVVLESSARAAAVCWMEAAWRLAPSASDWLEAETCWAAPPVCSDMASRVVSTSARGLTMVPRRDQARRAAEEMPPTRRARVALRLQAAVSEREAISAP